METQIIPFTLERETKNTIRYSEDADGKPPAIGVLYVQKWLVGKEPPQRLRSRDPAPVANRIEK